SPPGGFTGGSGRTATRPARRAQPRSRAPRDSARKRRKVGGTVASRLRPSANLLPSPIHGPIHAEDEEPTDMNYPPNAPPPGGYGAPPGAPPGGHGGAPPGGYGGPPPG